MIHRLINVHSVIPNSRREKDSNITFLYAVLEIWVNIAFLCHIGSHFEHHVTYDTYLNIVIVQTSSFDDHRKKCNQILHYQKNTCKRNCFLCCHLEYSRPVTRLRQRRPLPPRFHARPPLPPCF